MNIKEYFDKYPIPKSVFARKAGIGRSTLINLLENKVDILLKTAIAIEKATEGQVSINDWLHEEKDVDTSSNISKNTKRTKDH